ncbi:MULTISPECIES: phosphatase PAP2 family protein [Polaromonas]|uniref:Phosphatase PAP2 family protein n=1 Tax=Polaromonas aquatica TaxID=332657 RepID=A0ABW1TXT5_9BURK
MTGMQMPDNATQWLKLWLYNWGGANIDFFLAIQRHLPDGWLWLPEGLSALGSSYWGAPAVVILMLVWQCVRVRDKQSLLSVPLCRFVLGLALGMTAAALAKAVFALPRPAVVLGETVYRAVSAPDSLYSMPSGHSVYVGVLAAALWPAVGWPGRMGLLVFAVAVGWSRIVLGAHFPVDVVVGFALGWACVIAASPLARRVARVPLLTRTGRSTS